MFPFAWLQSNKKDSVHLNIWLSCECECVCIRVSWRMRMYQCICLSYIYLLACSLPWNMFTTKWPQFVTCRDLWMPGVNSFEIPWMGVPPPPSSPPFRLQLSFNTNFYFIRSWKSMFMHTASGWCTRPALPPSAGLPQHIRDTLPTLSILGQPGYYIKSWASEFLACFIQSYPSYIRIYYIK